MCRFKGSNNGSHSHLEGSTGSRSWSTDDTLTRLYRSRSTDDMLTRLNRPRSTDDTPKSTWAVASLAGTLATKNDYSQEGDYHASNNETTAISGGPDGSKPSRIAKAAQDRL